MAASFPNFPWTQEDFEERKVKPVCIGLCTVIAKGPGSNPSWGTKIPQATWHGQKQTNNKKRKTIGLN